MTAESTTRAAAPAGVSHLVLNVSDIERSHKFWTEVIGFQQCGELHDRPNMVMRFYRGGDPTHHHDLALAQVRDAEPASDAKWSMAPRKLGLNHVAISYPDRESWLAQLEHLQHAGVKFLVRGDHGMSHSVYISDPDGHGIELLYDLPSEVWEGDLDAALNHFDPLPTEGEAALADNTDYTIFGRARE